MGNMYNLVHGYNLACIFFLPMLGKKADEYPRFRDCFLSDDQKHIEILTRVGGNNRGQGYGEEELYKDPNFETTYDDEYDSTYGYYVFNPPQKWKKDFDAIVDVRFEDISDEYVKVLKEFYPKWYEDDVSKKIFGERKEEA